MANQLSPLLNTPQTENIHNTPAKPTSQPTSISKVRVIIRVRPFLTQERVTNPICCASVVGSEFNSDVQEEEVTVHIKDPYTSRNESYKLDAFFGQEDNNVGQIFQKELSPLIPGIFCGSNATVFAYGATGSGKTYTMQGTDELPGLMPLAMSTILSVCQNTGSSAEISYYEVYMDRCYDLLELKKKEIAVLDDKDGKIHLKGLARVPVHSLFEFHETFSSAIQRRKVGHTGLNDVSSRSHGVLVIAVSTPCYDGSGRCVTGKLNLIDLAGNEDNRRTCNEGIRLLESAKINQSLFALSNVIYALNNNKPRVPYRESKLTRILQDSLGGTSRALMVACLNPGEYQESVHTVSLAARSRHISNFIPSAQKQDTPKIKVDMEAKLRVWLESKGKTKSVQRMGAFGSPLLSGTPRSVRYMKKSSTCASSAKQKATSNQGASDLKERDIHTFCSNLFKNGGLAETVMEEIQDLVAERKTNNEFRTSNDRTVVESTHVHDGLLDEEGKPTTIKYTYSAVSPTSEKIKALQGSSRKVLSPININIRNISLRDQIHSVLHDPMTPKTPFMQTAENNYHLFGTPLDKYSSWSSKLKSSLVEDYIEFLNTATREELLEIKGIGQKMAEYILELRDTSPVKSLSDLEKIGLSSKQVHNMFGRAARGIFD